MKGGNVKSRLSIRGTSSQTTLILLLCSLAVLAGCAGGTAPATSSLPDPTALDSDLRRLIEIHELTGDPSHGRVFPSVNDPLVQLGKQLFFTRALSVNQDTACASCHLPTLGGGDGLSLPIGVNADDPNLIGPGRTHPGGAPLVPRNSPTTFNTVMWDQVLFHDGRVESMGKTPGANGNDGHGIRTPDVAPGQADPNAGRDLVIAQSRFPVTAEAEMRGFEDGAEADNASLRDYLASRLSGHAVGDAESYQDRAAQLSDADYWREAFAAVYGPADDPAQLITEQRIAEALGAYECSQVFVNTPWRAYVQGDDDALSEAAKRGAWLFLTDIEDGGAGCAACHTGDFFTDEQFHVLAVPQIGFGKGDGPDGSADFGRFRETGEWQDLYSFRTPSLVNVVATGPYGHDGAYTTLEGMIRHHFDPATAFASYDVGQLDPLIQTERMAFNTRLALIQQQLLQATDEETALPARLSDDHLADMVAFIHALTDPCVLDATCLQPWMPGDSGDPNGLQPTVLATR
jgi:cytochrome c peroxidase